MTDEIVKNIFADIPSPLKEELFEEIILSPHLKVERIISEGHKSPENFWYDQDKNEFVMLLSGSAELMFEDESIIKLLPGDYIIIPAHKKHRVEKTDTLQKTIWLAVHY